MTDLLDSGLALLKCSLAGVDRVVAQHQVVGVLDRRAKHKFAVLGCDEGDGRFAFLEGHHLAGINGVR